AERHRRERRKGGGAGRQHDVQPAVRDRRPGIRILNGRGLLGRVGGGAGGRTRDSRSLRLPMIPAPSATAPALPTGQGDATLMRTLLNAIRGAVSLEHSLRDLATWLRKP